jgi:hypothetical protein
VFTVIGREKCGVCVHFSIIGERVCDETKTPQCVHTAERN